MSSRSGRAGREWRHDVPGWADVYGDGGMGLDSRRFAIAIRGIWQPVVLTASGMVKIGDVQVVTKLPLPDTSKADVEINVPLENASDKPVKGTLRASIENVTVTKDVTVAPGKSEVKLAPAEFAQLTLQNPRLWWPNGYGKQELYTAKVEFAEGGKRSGREAGALRRARSDVRTESARQQGTVAAGGMFRRRRRGRGASRW